MDTAFDNSNNGATLDNLNQDIFQKSSVLTDGDLDMDMKNTNITSPSIDTLNNIQSYTIDNQKSSEIIDQNRISNDDYIIDENNQHSQVRNTAPLNGKTSEFNASDNYFGPESNVDDDTTTGSPVTDEFNAKDDEIENSVNILRPDELVSPHGIHFENIDFLKTVDEAEECDSKKDVDVDVADHHERNFDSEEFENESKMFSANTPADLVAESIKLVDAVLPEKIEDPIEDPIQPENVIVPESGEDSEDEWNYIKVNRNANENETQERNIISQETVESQNLCPDLVNDNQTQDDEIVGIEESSLSEADMASMLNPDAKEFVPTSPSPTNTTPVNPLDISDVTTTMATLHLNLEDEMVSQSPRKGTENTMVDVPVPEENDFLSDITQRPADLDSTVMSDIRPGSSSSQCSYQEMNLKEAMHGDEKQEYAPDVLNTPDQVGFEINSTNGDHEEFISILNKSMRNQDVMNASFYNDGTSDSNNPFKVDLNAVHRLPTSDDENEEDNVENTTGTTTYSVEDTEFGMNDFIQMQLTGVQNGASGMENGVNVSESKSNESDSIVGAVQEMISENMAVLGEYNLLGNEALPDALPTAENTLPTTFENIISFVGEVEEPAADIVSIETDNSTSPTAVEELPTVSVVSNLISEQCLVPEQQPHIVVENESISETNVNNDIAATVETIAKETVAPVVVAGAVAAVAVAAAVATTKAKSTKPAEPKSKTAPVAAKKPLSAVTAKPKTKPSTVTDTTATKTAPIARPRTVASQPPVKAIERKTTSSLAAKKPVNGEVKTTTSVSAAKRPASSTTTLKSTTSARASTSTTSTTSTTTTTRVAASRLITKTSTTSAAADAPKRVATTKTTTTTSSTTLKPRPTSTLTKSPISKANTSATDKSTKDTVNKLQTSGARAPVSPRSVTATATSRTGTLPLKKADAAKVPSAPAPIKRPTSSTLEKRVPAAVANSKLVPTQKRPISSSTNRSTTLETVKKTASTLKKDTKSQANVTNVSKPKENGNETNGTHAFDMPVEINDSVNVEQEQPVIM